MFTAQPWETNALMVYDAYTAKSLYPPETQLPVCKRPFRAVEATHASNIDCVAFPDDGAAVLIQRFL
jgi:hypothetical protein